TFTYREEYYLDGHSPEQRLSGNASENVLQHWQNRLNRARNKADVIVAKNRHGKPETVHLSFNGEYSLFDNLQFNGQPTPESDFASQYPQTENPQSQSSGIDINDIPDDII
ncbi:MAG: hypothetical protein MJ163_02780, partial [Alphaproteobacteria bacterium]|nr:hypothetical protein [Alphaproteobacteria bacterium]